MILAIITYLANKIPIDAVPIHAVNINAPCNLKNNFDLPPTTETSAKFDDEADAILPIS